MEIIRFILQLLLISCDFEQITYLFGPLFIYLQKRIDQDLGTWGCLFQLVLSNASFQAVACKPPAHPPPTGDPSLLPSHVSQAFSWQNFDDFRNTVANKSAAPSVSICWCLMCSVCVVRCIYF